jgi:hypothetical protein
MLLVASSPVSASPYIGSYGFHVQITLSAKATVRLRKSSEGIIASARYYGYPNPGWEKYADEVGQIPVGAELVQLPGNNGSVVIKGTKVNRKRLPWLQGPPSVNVNVFSARRSGPDNILTCDFFDGNVSDAQEHPIAIHCSLIEENAPISQKF